tara:strand:+ start:33 stop:701 length:669 start_codon:yes stop_codon:yes gene_type:complete
MATLNEIAYNIRNIVSGGVTSDDTDVSLRQIKFMIHYHRANLLVKYTDNGRKTSNACYQVDEVTPSLNGVTLKDVVGFNDNKAIRSIAYKDDSSIESSYVPLPIVQNHDRMFVGSSRFMLQNSGKLAGLSDRKLYIWEGDNLVTNGTVEINAVFANPTDVSSYVDDDTTQYPVPEELIPMIVQNVMQIEFNVMLKLNAKGPNNQVDEAKAKGKKKPQQKVQR